MRSRAALSACIAFVAAFGIVHGIIGWLSPIQGDDWLHWVWAAKHASDSPLAYALAFAAHHFTFADLIGFLVARVDVVHAIGTPIVGIALVVGIFVLGLGRLPRATSWDDVLALVLASALLWIAAPRAGLVWFHRPYAASQIWGCALVVWVMAPYRCGWTVRRGWLPLFVIGALLAGTSTRQLGISAVVIAAVAIGKTPRDQRARWMWLGIAALVVGLIPALCVAPYFEIFKLIKRGLEPGFTQFGFALREGGEVITLVAVLAFVSLVLAKLRPTLPSPLSAADAFEGLDHPHPRALLRWLGIWLGVGAVALCGPHYSEALLFPPAVVLAAAALPVLRSLSRVWPIRVVLVALALGTHVVAWAYALPLYIEMGATFRDRIHRLETAPHYSVPTVPTYTQVAPGFMFYGEDWGAAERREMCATELFDLRDIVLATDFRRLENNPDIEVRLDATGLSASELAAATPPYWGKTIPFQRMQFKDTVAALRSTVTHPFSVRLAVTNIQFAQLAGRPLYVDWYESGTLLAPHAARSNIDVSNRFTVTLDHRSAAQFTEAWTVGPTETASTPIEDDHVKFMPLYAGVYVVVMCNRDRCLAADAFAPRF